jgi:hypothetical protein
MLLSRASVVAHFSVASHVGFPYCRVGEIGEVWGNCLTQPSINISEATAALPKNSYRTTTTFSTKPFPFLEAPL